jgi:hypothetical protein
MDDYIFKIHQDPLSRKRPLLAERPNPFLFEGLLDRLRNGLYLAIGLTATKEKVVSERAQSFQLKKDRGLGLLFNGSLQAE